MTAHINYPSTYKKREREREEVVRKNEYDNCKPPVSEGVNHRSLVATGERD